MGEEERSAEGCSVCKKFGGAAKDKPGQGRKKWCLVYQGESGPSAFLRRMYGLAPTYKCSGVRHQDAQAADGRGGEA